MPASLFCAALRLRPDRVILAESCDLALQRLAIMAGSHDAARGYSESRLVRLAILSIDVIAHLRRTPAGRRMSGVHFDPAASRGLAGDLRDSGQGGRPEHQSDK